MNRRVTNIKNEWNHTTDIATYWIAAQAAERSGVAAKIHLHTKAEADIPNEEDTALCPGMQVGDVTT
jgi:hypothetical protein